MNSMRKIVHTPVVKMVYFSLFDVSICFISGDT